MLSLSLRGTWAAWSDLTGELKLASKNYKEYYLVAALEPIMKWLFLHPEYTRDNPQD